MKARVIYGAPGCGKTRRLAGLASSGLQPVHFVSHTKAAAEEATARTGAIAVCSTLHSLCFRLKGFEPAQVVDEAKLTEFGRVMGIQFTGASAETNAALEPGDLMLALEGLARATGTDPSNLYQRSSERPVDLRTFNWFCSNYKRWKDVRGYVDFNDMLEEYVNDPAPHDIRRLFVDEAQDLSPLQWLAIKALTTRGAIEEVVIAGDDDQAIYVWGGADSRGMRLFEKKWNADREVLGKSYRLPARIHQLAQRVIGRIRDRVPKEFTPRDEDGVAEQHGSVWTVPLNGGVDTLMLYRNHALAREVEEMLVQRAMPYVKVGGRSPFDSDAAAAVRAWQQLAKREAVTEKQMKMLEQHTKLPLDVTVPGGWRHQLKVPTRWLSYFDRVDLFATPTVRISTIHAAKGREAERVVLLTGMTGRTLQGYIQDRDAETRTFYVGLTRAKQELYVVHGMEGFPI